MIKKYVCIIFACLLLISTASATEAVNLGAPRASYYLSSYSAGLKASSNGKMTVSYSVIGTRTMDKIGIDEILIEYWDGSDWFSFGNVSGADHPEFYVTDDSSHAGSYSFTGIKGLVFRATVTVYAERSGGSDTGSVSSYDVKCT